MNWRKVLEEMGFEHIEGCTYKKFGREFNFSTRQSTDSIAAEIWDVAQNYGEEKREREIMANIFKRRF
jgi:hypothetical protein